jgi:uncharacterized protein YbjT (DUF2867 family)
MRPATIDRSTAQWPTRIIAVAGATGQQGGGLVRAILSDRSGEFTARAITRDPTTEKARALADLGAEVVQANLHVEESVLSRIQRRLWRVLRHVLLGAHVAEKEFAEARNLASAAGKAGAVSRVGSADHLSARLFLLG